MSTGPGVAPAPVSSTRRSVLADLLHALNQPLTGLQCSLELAVATPRTPAQYIRTLDEGLELLGRMRLLVQAIREITDLPLGKNQATEWLALDDLVRESAASLALVAESRSVRLKSECLGPLLVRQNRNWLEGLLFRWLESAIALARPGTQIAISTSTERLSGLVAVSWNEGPGQEHSPFTRAELGLLIARAGWEQTGATWTQESAGGVQTCAVRTPLAADEVL